MEEPLYALLNQCTAKILIPESDDLGSGFFVAPGLLLTCEHVVRSARASLEKIEVYWESKPVQALTKSTDIETDGGKKPYQVVKMETDAVSDLALLHVNITDHPCVFLSKEPPLPFDNLYSYGYNDINPFGDPATFELEGKDGSQQERLKFKAGLVRPGQSGSPLLNINSGYVCGVVQITLDRRGKVGGRAIPGPSIFQAFPEIETRQQLFHRKDQRWRWMDCLWENTGLPEEDATRLRLLQKVRVSWIKDFLEEHLGETAYILLGLSALPEAIDNPLRLPKQQADQSGHVLPSHTTITQVYDQTIEGSLLILGEPGGGKTTMLLELARHLLERARLNNRHPIPVVFKLSSWTVKQPLADWLIEELSRFYGMSRDQSKSWIENDQVLPLLDGLDEVRQNSLTACVQAINTFRQEHNSLRMVVSCNKEAYLTQSARLRMRSAVVVQPLTTEQIDECLESAGPQLERLRMARLKDSVLQNLLTIPLMLNILMAIFRDMPDDEDLLTSGPLERQQIFAKYVQRRFEDQDRDQNAKSPYSSSQAIHWLSYLAKQLRREGLTRFSVENIQPGWLGNSNKYLYRVYNWCIGSTYGLVFGLPILLVGEQLVVRGQSSSLPLVIWLVFGFVCGILYPIRSMRIRPAEAITWSWKGFRSGLITGAVLGIVLGAFLSTVIAMGMGIPEGMSRGDALLSYLRTYGTTYGVLLGMIFGMIFGLFRGLFPKQLIVRTTLLPNRGMRSSIRNGVLIGLLLCPVIGMAVAFVVWRLFVFVSNFPFSEQYSSLVSTLLYGLITGLYIGLIFALFKGLGAFVQHYLLRFLLWCTNSLPWHLVHFLDEVTKQHLLNRVGSNYYIFWHDAFLVYFATLDELASTAPKKASLFHRKPRLSLIGQLFTGPLPGPASPIRLAWQMTLRVLLALLIIGLAGLTLGFWKPAQPSSTIPVEYVPTPPPVVTIASTPLVTTNSPGTILTGTITEFTLPHFGNEVGGMVIGPDGNLWFTDVPDVFPFTNLIGRITPTGNITEFSIPGNDAPFQITAGPDGNLWFTEGGHIGRITLSGQITEFALPTEGTPDGITKGPDGNLWFTQNGVDKIGRITPSGQITEFALPTKPENGSGPEGMTTGPDGNLWFTEWYGNVIGRITLTGQITEFALPIDQSGPKGITTGPDGNLWFTEVNGHQIGRITPSGKITEFALSAGSVLEGITAGPDGNLWFTDVGQIGRITPSGRITEFTVPSTNISFDTISFGPKAHLWFADNYNNTIGYMTSTQFNA